MTRYLVLRNSKTREVQKRIPIETIGELRDALNGFRVRYNVKLATVWGRKWEEWIGYTKDGQSMVHLDNGKW